MDLATSRPEALVDGSSAAEVLAAVRLVGVLGPPAILAVDFVLRQWTLAALARPSDVEGLLELDELAATAAQRLPNEPGSAVHRHRWQAFRDLIESKRLAVRGATSGRARNLLHAQPILDHLTQGQTTQSALRAAVGLSPARLSQVLAVMEEGGLIHRRKRGKENVVSLPPRPEQAAGDAAPKPRPVGHLVWSTRVA